MKIAVIVPSNNVKNINAFIDSFFNMKEFSKKCELVIIANGDLKPRDINSKEKFHFIGYYNDFDIVPFATLRALGMSKVECNYFLFLDDDNLFPNKSDEFYMKCYNFLELKRNCSILQAERFKKGLYGFKRKVDGFFWTGYGLFIKNVNLSYLRYTSLYGACEDLLYSYETLNKEGLPYIVYGNPTTRDKSKPNDWNQKNNKNYSKELLDDNIIGYIKEKYDNNWDFYSNIKNLKLPKKLQEKLNER